MYVDDLVSGGETVKRAQQLKEDARVIFDDASFELRKWHSNAPELEDKCEERVSDETTFEKDSWVRVTLERVLNF